MEATRIDAALFDELENALKEQGPEAAIDRLCQGLCERKDYGAYFYALLLKKRYELGLPPVPQMGEDDIPEALQGPYEDAIREACRKVGRMLLDEGNIPQAYMYYQMIGETEPVAEALEKVEPDTEDGDEVQPLVEIGFHYGVHPKRGFDLLLKTYGLCSAITAMSNAEGNLPGEARQYCVKQLVRTLYAELSERLVSDIVAKEGKEPADKRVGALIQGRDWLFADEAFHVDLSHLSSVVQMALQLKPGEELEMVRELCEYGKRLSPAYGFSIEPPFENQYEDFAVYFSILAGDKVEEGLAHFRKKVEAMDPEENDTAPAEVLVNLLLACNRLPEALETSRRYLATAPGRRLACPSFIDLCHRAKDYQTLAEVAREQGDSVNFLAGLLSARNGSGA
ncbi:MAG: hypothetical protein KatS3mg105_2787 [Gemmatales bacterium]|nr:MAG: hypothetical protein KatS3mg105_2787 [Gemmatales bacterium]